MPGPVNFRGVRLGVPVCEDIWGELGVCETLAEAGAEILLVPNGSPYHREKMDVRYQIALRQIIETRLPMLYANQVGGQDELVFDGGSFVINSDHKLAVQMNQFETSVVTTTWRRGQNGWTCDKGLLARLPDIDEADWRACVMGLRDYVNKNGFGDVVLGLSGGVDSAICAAMAVDALGEERVRCVMMPYKYTSKDSLADARSLRQRARRALRDRADRSSGRRIRGGAGAGFCRDQFGHHRRKPAVAGPRRQSSWRSPTSSVRWW